MTYQEVINWGKKELQNNQIYDGFGFRLMFELCELNNINLYLDKDNNIDEQLLETYQEGIERLTKNEPLGHVLGFEWVYGRRFVVNNKVLIPREETEELIGFVLADIADYFPQNLTIFDIATGSGNLGITLAAELPEATVYASDISSEAIEVAQINNQNFETHVTFFVGDMGQPFIDHHLKADVIVCNPPYIQAHEEVETSVYNYEPHVALFGGTDGLDFYRQLLDQVPQLINEKGMIAFEMGFDQRENLENEIQQRLPDAHIHFEKDMNGLDRMCFVYIGITNLD